MSDLLFNTAEWDFPMLQRIDDACAKIAHEEMGLDTYPNRIEIITAEQMLDAYASIGLPHNYSHWSFGKHLDQETKNYQKGRTGLAYEIVINSNPCVVYLMEENTSTMQALTISHAAYGHNTFFKTNYLFKQWTDADGILDYVKFAKNYIASCEERYGAKEVELILDAAHALMSQGVFRYQGRRINLTIEERDQQRRDYDQATFNDLWRTIPKDAGKPTSISEEELKKRNQKLGLPQENILYFLEKHAPKLKTWQREILRIVRNMAQYFYPQRQTQICNEGTASYCHYRIMNRLYDKGLLSEGNMLEFLHSHSGVVYQPDWNHPHFNDRLNPYYLGFNIMMDIERIVKNPTAEDKEWFPDIAGTGNEMAVLRDVWVNYRDESLISQFLSPHLMRKMRLFHVYDGFKNPTYEIKNIQDATGFKEVRRTLSKMYDVGNRDEIEIVAVDLEGDRTLKLQRKIHGGFLHEKSKKDVLTYLSYLWGYAVELNEIGEDGACKNCVVNTITSLP